MIGHLQRRKAPRVIGICDLLHSVDTVRLAERLDRFVPAGAPPLPVLVQVNTSGEAAKSGFLPEEAPEAVHRVCELPGGLGARAHDHGPVHPIARACCVPRSVPCGGLTSGCGRSRDTGGTICRWG